MSDDADVERELLARLHADPRRNLSGREVIEEVADGVDETADEVDRIAGRLDGEGYVDHRGGITSTISLTPRGLRRYEALSGETVVGSDAEGELLGLLVDHAREHPDSPAVDRTRVVDELDLPERHVDTLVWYLDAVGLVDAVGGTEQAFFTVAIAERGRPRRA